LPDNGVFGEVFAAVVADTVEFTPTYSLVDEALEVLTFGGGHGNVTTPHSEQNRDSSRSPWQRRHTTLTERELANGSRPGATSSRTSLASGRSK
jgi:hypothetical protein